MTDEQLTKSIEAAQERSEKMRPYRQHFRKKPTAWLKPFNLTPRSDLFESLAITKLQSQADVKTFILNPIGTLVDMIRQKESKVCYVNEGLIATYPTADLIKHYQREYAAIVDPSLSDFKFSDVYGTNADDQLISQFVSLSDPNEKVSPLVKVCFPCHDVREQQDILKKLINSFEQYGYFYQTTEDDKVGNIILCYVQFEAKYTDMLVDLSDVLYHVSPLKNLKKIVHKGLIPHPVDQTGLHHAKQDKPEFSYLPRVYMFNRCQQDRVFKYGVHIASKSRDVGFCVFKVDKKKLVADQIFANGKQKFYLDPAFSMSDTMTDQTAIYTYGNVPLRVLDDQVLIVKTHGSEIASSEVKSLKSELAKSTQA